jgi:hypothetical protein
MKAKTFDDEQKATLYVKRKMDVESEFGKIKGIFRSFETDCVESKRLKLNLELWL